MEEDENAKPKITRSEDLITAAEIAGAVAEAATFAHFLPWSESRSARKWDLCRVYRTFYGGRGGISGL